MQPFRRLDVIIIITFMRLSHWVDYRFHRNQYDLAAWFIRAGIAMNFALTASNIAHSWLMGGMNVLASGMIALAYSGDLRRLGEASIAYEKNPAYIPRAATFYFWVPYWTRMAILFFGIQLWSIIIMIDVLSRKVSPDCLTSAWMIVVAAGVYTAAGLPPARPRKKKEVRMPAGAAGSPC